MSENFALDEVIDYYDELRPDRRIPVSRGRILSKSKFLNGLQCPKLLWTRANTPEVIPDPSAMLQQIFSSGHNVGLLATSLFPGGQHLQEEDFVKNLEQTRSLLDASPPRPIYEAGIQAGRLYARADILQPSKIRPGAWDIYEVKCSTKCKDVYLWDIAFQKYCYEQAGLSIGQCFLLHIDNTYVRQGQVDPQELFTSVNVTGDLENFSNQIPHLVDGFLEIMDMAKCPAISIGPHCSKPYTCQMKPLCWGSLPPGNVTELYNARGKQFVLLDQGIDLIADIPEDFELTNYQQIQYACAVTKKEHLDQDALKGFLQSLEYPLYFMDFETIFEPVPRFDGTRPYQQIPFQYSIHVQDALGGSVRHIEYLHQGPDDPRLAFARSLKENLGEAGTILVFNEVFEKSRLKELATDFSGFAQWYESVLGRIIDLLVPFRKGYYYTQKQAGSNSMKKVLPALTNKGYAGMGISEGGQASMEYARVTYGENISSEDRGRVYTNLREYCCLDTLGMVDILERLHGMVK